MLVFCLCQCQHFPDLSCASMKRSTMTPQPRFEVLYGASSTPAGTITLMRLHTSRRTLCQLRRLDHRRMTLTVMVHRLLHRFQKKITDLQLQNRVLQSKIPQSGLHEMRYHRHHRQQRLLRLHHLGLRRRNIVWIVRVRHSRALFCQCRRGFQRGWLWMHR